MSGPCVMCKWPHNPLEPQLRNLERRNHKLREQIVILETALKRRNAQIAICVQPDCPAHQPKEEKREQSGS